MPITAKVQNQGVANTVQPSTNSSVSAAGTRLRRKLSKIFQRDSAESGFCWRRAPPPALGSAQLTSTRGSNHWAICQSPRIHLWRRLTSAL